MRWFWRKLTGHKAIARVSQSPDVSPGEAVTRSRMLPAPITAVRTDPGCHRAVNEDFVRWIMPEDSKQLSSRGMMMILADGMGGHSAGEVASRIAVEIISQFYYASNDSPATALTQAFHTANRAIFQAADQQSEWSGMGTTCTALVILGNEALIAHVGDSRLYLIRKDEIYRMTEDHSAVRELVRRGLLNETEAQQHEEKNLILRALGTRPEVSVCVWAKPFPLNRNDQFVLCSDGLSDLLTDLEIKLSLNSDDLDAACQNLVSLARSRGGYDNITVGVLSFHSAHQYSQSKTPAPNHFLVEGPIIPTEVQMLEEAHT